MQRVQAAAREAIPVRFSVPHPAIRLARVVTRIGQRVSNALASAAFPTERDHPRAIHAVVPGNESRRGVRYHSALTAPSTGADPGGLIASCSAAAKASASAPGTTQPVSPGCTHSADPQQSVTITGRPHPSPPPPRKAIHLQGLGAPSVPRGDRGHRSPGAHSKSMPALSRAKSSLQSRSPVAPTISSLTRPGPSNFIAPNR